MAPFLTMAKKRKLESKSSAEAESSKQEREREELEEEEEEEEEELYEEYEEIDDEDEDEDEDEEEEEEEEEEDDQSANAKMLSASAANQGDNDTDEPIQNLLEPFSKEQLINILREAADKHSDVADRIRHIADEDPAHRKIFVHGLGWDSTIDTLTSVFKQYGEIEDCKVVCDKATGKSKGYGFILFKSRSGSQKALKQPQKKIGNRMTACQLATIGPVTGAVAVAPVPQALPVSEQTLKKIYVSNVGAELDPQKLLNFFSKYGEIEDGPLGLDKVTGKPKGFCLFVYKKIESAQKALEEPHKNFEGHILHCQKAIDGPKPGKPKPQQISHTQNSHFQKNENPSFGSAAGLTPHLMAPSAPGGMSFNQGPAPQALNSTLGQALTAFLASQGAGLGLTNLLGTLSAAGVGAPAVPGTGHGIQGGYGNQAMGSNINTGVMGGYGSQGGLQAAYTNQQMGHGGVGRPQQHGTGYMGGTPYL